MGEQKEMLIKLTCDFVDMFIFLILIKNVVWGALGVIKHICPVANFKHNF